MMQGTYTAAMGINAQQKRIDTIANNVANVNTNGFKSSRADFKDALYSTMMDPVQPQADLNLEKGHGTLVTGFVRSFAPGIFTETQSETDCYIQGDGFFAVRTPSGETMYTRDGHFEKSVEADGTYLRTSNGNYVLGADGQRIRLQDGTVSIGTDGSIAADNNAPYARLQIVDFPNRQGLESVSSNLYRVSETSGAARAANGYTIISGALEGSNVNLADEFSRLIRGQRALQMSSRALSTADGMDETAINVRR